MKLEIVEDGDVVGGCEGGPDTAFSWWYRGSSDKVQKALMTADHLTLPSHNQVEAGESDEVSSQSEAASDREKVLHVERAVQYLPHVEEVRRV